MRKATVWIIVVLFACIGSVCFADTEIPVDVSAQVPDMLEISSWIKWFMDDNPESQGNAESFGFGELTHILADGDDAGVWFSRKWFTIYLVGSTGGRRYQLKQTCTGVTYGNDNINSTFLVTPNYSIYDWLEPWGDPNGQGPMPGTLGDAALAVTTDHVIYTSDADGQSKIIQAIYSIPNDSDVGGFEAISYDQPQGVYTGEVTFSVVLY